MNAAQESAAAMREVFFATFLLLMGIGMGFSMGFAVARYVLGTDDHVITMEITHTPKAKPEPAGF
jgi:hypothetical protein